MKPNRKQIDDEVYGYVKAHDPVTHQNIVAFASTFGTWDEEIDLSTRYQVERYCMGLVKSMREGT